MPTALRLVLALSLLAPTCLCAQEPPGPGEYEVVAQPVTPRDPTRILVEEFFWYGCPHCFALEPALERWAGSTPADVDFTPVPNSLGRDVGMLHSRAYYTQVLLGVSPKVHRQLFDAIHVEHMSLSTPEVLEQFIAAKAGLPAATVESAFNSFMVDSNVRRSEDLAQRYGLSGTPTIVVDGKYKVKAAPPDRMLSVVDALIERVRHERASPAASTPPPGQVTAQPSPPPGAIPQDQPPTTTAAIPATAATPPAPPTASMGGLVRIAALTLLALLVLLGIWAWRSRR